MDTVKASGGNRQLLFFHDHFGGRGEDGFHGCKGIWELLVNVKSQSTRDQTWVTEVEGFTPYSQEVLSLLPKPESIADIIGDGQNELATYSCYSLCGALNKALAVQPKLLNPCDLSNDNGKRGYSLLQQLHQKKNLHPKLVAAAGL